MERTDGTCSTSLIPKLSPSIVKTRTGDVRATPQEIAASQAVFNLTAWKKREEFLMVNICKIGKILLRGLHKVIIYRVVRASVMFRILFSRIFLTDLLDDLPPPPPPPPLSRGKLHLERMHASTSVTRRWQSRVSRLDSKCV